MTDRRHVPALCLLLLVVAGLCTSCTPSVRRVDPPPGIPDHFSAGGDGVVPDRWWTTFEDDRLDALVQRALSDNFSLKVAWDRLDQARAVARKAGAPLSPTLDLSFDTSRTVNKQHEQQRTYTTSYRTGLVARYELDLWGRIRNAAQAATLDAEATRQDVQAAAITLSSQVALTWYELVEQQGQLTILDSQLKTNRDYLDIITTRFKKGLAAAADVLQQRELVESTRGQQLLVRQRIAVLENQLAVLTGRAPGVPVDDLPDQLPRPTALPDTGLLMTLLRRRPDVVAGELRVLAADRRVASAIADRFPTLSIAARYETTAADPGMFFQDWIGNLATNLAAPLLDGGLRAAEVERTRAVLSERINGYGATVLAALQDVEDALAREARQREYVESLSRRLDLSGKATEQTLDRYSKGAVDFTRYLTTLLSYQQLQRTHLRARLELLEYRIELYRALAGAWALERPERATLATHGPATDQPESR